MSNYAAMYKKLFNAQTDAIALLQQAQRETEEMYMSAQEPQLHVLEPKPDTDPEKE